jgi:transposase
METEMADGGFGFEARIAVVQRMRGYRKWLDEVKARIVAESFRAGVRVVDVVRRLGALAHQLSDWRRQARQGLLALPEDVVEGLEWSRRSAPERLL